MNFIRTHIRTLRTQLERIPRYKWGKQAFLLKLNGKKAKILDIGCGNDSPIYTKRLCRDCYYVGVDVGDYNQSKQSIDMADEYRVFTPEDFANGIDTLDTNFDAVISSHNIEHCNKPIETLQAMCRRLKAGGKLFLSFPNSDSVNFPHRQGTLNFYDDSTHIYLPDFNKIQQVLQDQEFTIIKAIKSYKPVYYWFWGGVSEIFSRRQKKILRGTWAFWGFESVIVAEK